MTGKVGARPSEQALAVPATPAVAVDGPSGFDPSRVLEGEILRPESCDAEVADMMERLSRLQTWLVLQCTSRRGDPDYLSAMRLVQDVRVLIVERCFNHAAQGTEARRAETLGSVHDGPVAKPCAQGEGQ